MFKGKTVLVQMQEIISRYELEKTVFKHSGDKGTRAFKTKNLLSVMLYVHMSAKQSLRSTNDSLMSKKKIWYHLGITSISRNNLSHSLKMRSHEIFEEIFYTMLGKFNNARGEMKDKRFKFKMPVVSFDSTTIGLCLSLFEWAKFRKTKAGIKLHVMYNNKKQLPGFINVSPAKIHDIKGAQSFEFSKNTIYTFDKGYISLQ